MKNETVTLDRELAEQFLAGARQCDRERLRAALAEPVPPAGGEVEVLGYRYNRESFAAPQFSAGEHVALRHDKSPVPLVDRAHATRLQAELKTAVEACDDYGVRVVELQAEVERLKDRLADANAIANLATTNLQEFKEDHQAVLTKTLEDLSTANDKLRRQDIASQYKDGQITKHDGELAMLQAELNKARELLDAIANWPDGGSCYGQENIKVFVIANREG